MRAQAHGFPYDKRGCLFFQLADCEIGRSHRVKKNRLTRNSRLICLHKFSSLYQTEHVCSTSCFRPSQKWSESSRSGQFWPESLSWTSSMLFEKQDLAVARNFTILPHNFIESHSCLRLTIVPSALSNPQSFLVCIASRNEKSTTDICPSTKRRSIFSSSSSLL